MNASEYKVYQDAVAHFLKSNDVKPGCFGLAVADTEPFFSWSPCACCRSTLGGNREEYSFACNDGTIFQANICSGCVYYLTYDRLDDATMAEVEKGANQ